VSVIGICLSDITSCSWLQGKVGWNDNDLFIGTEWDIHVVSVDINDSSISTFCYGAQASVSPFL
jgi:hypothetical protein